MAQDKARSHPEAGSAMGPIAHALIQHHLGPDHKVTDMERFFTALTQALHDAYEAGAWHWRAPALRFRISQKGVLLLAGLAPFLMKPKCTAV